MKLFKNTSTKKKLSSSKLKEIKGDIRKIYVAKSYLHREIFYYDFRDSKNDFQKIRNLMKKDNKILKEIIEMVINEKLEVSNMFKHFSARVYYLNKDIEEITKNIIVQQKEIIKIFIIKEFGNPNMKIEEDYKDELEELKKVG